MNVSPFNTSILANKAIVALKDAYEKCSEKAAKESIITAFQAVILLHHDLVNQNYIDKESENESDCDPSEYCAAV
jgi:hypothetical protein